MIFAPISATDAQTTSAKQLCGDHIDVIEQEDGSTIIVLADGLGSGVKASILSTLTSKMLSHDDQRRSVARGMRAYDGRDACRSARVRQVAYSTFTVVRLCGNNRARSCSMTTPLLILLRDGRGVRLSQKTELNIEGKKIYYLACQARRGRYSHHAMSDGCVSCGRRTLCMNFGWKRSDIVDFMKTYCHRRLSRAKTLSTVPYWTSAMRLYGGEPGDDTSTCAVRVRKRAADEPSVRSARQSRRRACKHDEPVLLQRGQTHRLRRHDLVDRGKISRQAAARASLNYARPATFRPLRTIEGIDLVTEGVITINQVAGVCQGLPCRQRSCLRQVELQARRRVSDCPACCSKRRRTSISSSAARSIRRTRTRICRSISASK